MYCIDSRFTNTYNSCVGHWPTQYEDNTIIKVIMYNMEITLDKIIILPTDQETILQETQTEQ